MSDPIEIPVPTKLLLIECEWPVWHYLHPVNIYARERMREMREAGLIADMSTHAESAIVDLKLLVEADVKSHAADDFKIKEEMRQKKIH